MFFSGGTGFTFQWNFVYIILMSVIVLKKAASQTLLNHEITQQNKNRAVFLQYLIVIRKSSGCSLRDATSERDPK